MHSHTKCEIEISKKISDYEGGGEKFFEYLEAHLGAESALGGQQNNNKQKMITGIMPFFPCKILTNEKKCYDTRLHAAAMDVFSPCGHRHIRISLFPSLFLTFPKKIKNE